MSLASQHLLLLKDFSPDAYPKKFAIHMPQVTFAVGTEVSLQHVQKLTKVWNLCSRQCNT